MEQKKTDRFWFIGAPQPSAEARLRWGGAYNPKAEEDRTVKEALEKDAAEAAKGQLGPTMSQAVKDEAFVGAIESLLKGEGDPASIGGVFSLFLAIPNEIWLMFSLHSRPSRGAPHDQTNSGQAARGREKGQGETPRANDSRES